MFLCGPNHSAVLALRDSVQSILDAGCSVSALLALCGKIQEGKVAASGNDIRAITCAIAEPGEARDLLSGIVLE